MMTSRNKKNDEIQSCWFFFGGHKSDRKMYLMFVNINYWINLAVDYRDMSIYVVLYGQDLGFLKFFSVCGTNLCGFYVFYFESVNFISYSSQWF